MKQKVYEGRHDVVRDDGCDVSPRCVDCPLKTCRYDDPREYMAWKREQRAKHEAEG